MPINELRSIATFAKAVELGSIRRAAQAQGVTPQAASQSLAQLEQHLGVRLLHRTTRRLALTDEGRRLLEATQPALAALERALLLTQNARDEIAGPLRIVGPRSSFAPILMPLLAEFCQRYPEVQPDVMLDDALGNWVQDRVDVGFRLGNSPDDGLIARRLMPMQLIVCASPAYLAQHGLPQTPDDLPQHRCSLFRHQGTGQIIPWFLNCEGEVLQRLLPPTLTTNDADLELHAVLSGQVIAQLANFTAAPYVRNGQLVPLLLSYIPDSLNLYLYYGNRTAQPRRVRAFIDLAVERLGHNPAYVLSAEELAAAQSRGLKGLA